jgi:hypothetical protein
MERRIVRERRDRDRQTIIGMRLYVLPRQQEYGCPAAPHLEPVADRHVQKLGLELPDPGVRISVIVNS